MKRRMVPILGMSHNERETQLGHGLVCTPLNVSMATDPQRLNPHYHDFFQVTLFHGPTRLMHDFRETEVSGYSLFFVSPGQVHTIVPGPELTGTIVSFHRQFFEGHGDNGSAFLLELPFYFAADKQPWLQLNDATGNMFSILFAQMQSEYDQALPGSIEMLHSLMRILFVQARRIYAHYQPASAANRGAALTRRFQLEIEKHFYEWSSLSAYARTLGVSVNHLNDVVAETTGLPAGEHLRRRKLLDAKRLLLHSDLGIAEIAYRVGFKDPAYFGRFFRRYETCTPADFREQIREKYQQDRI